MFQDLFTVALLPSFGPWELAVIGMVSLLIFGNRLPSVMRSLGKSVVEFKKGMNSIEEEVDEASNADPKKPEPAVKDA
ncbi:Sec-independent protein translocase subunit TatA/TatB [Tautonia plasticadhaerens]|uniref:Sec-independent protein translocase protein TatA n=1 Tax=Tautonia plasticadhaerens TaxID=2527974 RepID=A0A518H832_9BACT|nr:twin-arginine translocase TatA/TatE family subunit [Tautonia plasticadhaerens]QDV37019.1 twin arginine translocase protein A [Tautonia plasticadhaerens]